MIANHGFRNSLFSSIVYPKGVPLTNKDLTPEARNAIQDQIKDKVNYSNTILKNDIENVDKMSSEEKQRLLDIASLQAVSYTHLRAHET